MQDAPLADPHQPAVQAIEDPFEIANHLSVALRIRIRRLSVGQETEVLASHLVAWKTGHFILADSPESDGKQVHLLSGEALGVSFVLEGVAYGFASELLRWMQEPARMIFIRFPDRMEIKMFRRHKRITVKIESEIQFTPEPGKDETAPGTIADISSSGCQLFSGESFDIGSPLALRFELPGGSQIDGLHSVVRRAASVSDRYVYGIEFLSTNPEPFQRFQSFVAIFEEIPL